MYLWITLINRLDSFQNNLHNFFCLGIIQLFSIGRTIFLESMFGKSPYFAKILHVCSQTFEMVWYFLKKNLLFSKTMAALRLRSSRYQSAFLLLWKKYGIFSCWVGFVEQNLIGEWSRNCISVWFVWIKKFDLFQNNRFNLLYRRLTQQFTKFGISLDDTILWNVCYVGAFQDPKKEKVKKFAIFPCNETFCSPILSSAFRKSVF